MKKIGQLLILTLFIILFTNSTLLASETEYIVKSGDSLWKIACEHGVSVNDLMTINQLQSDRLNIGDRLKIGSASTLSQAASSLTQNRICFHTESGCIQPVETCRYLYRASRRLSGHDCRSIGNEPG